MSSKGQVVGGPVNPKPKCFNTMMARANHATSKRDRDKSKSLSGRFLSNLFMPTVDAELVGEFLESFDMQKCADDFDHKSAGPEEENGRNKEIEDDRGEGGDAYSSVAELLKLDHAGKDITRGAKKKSEIPLNYLNKHTRLSNPLSVMGDSYSGLEIPGVAQGSVTSSYLSDTREGMCNTRSLDDNMSAITGDGDGTETFVNISDEQSYVTLPSIHSGVQMKLSSDKAERYFGKKARGDFFEKYRHMSSTKMSFAKPVMTRNDDQVWENVALLSEEEKRERTRKYRGADTESGPRSPARSRSPSPINVLLSGRVPMGDLTTRSYTGSPGPGGSPKDSDNGSHPSGAMGPSEGNWATDMAIFNNAVEELDHEFLADASPSKLRRGDTMGSLGGYQYEEMEEDDELSAITGHDDRSTVSLVHSHLKGSMRLPSLSSTVGLSLGMAQQSSGGPGGIEEEAGHDILSPRQQYLASCIDRGLAPLPSLVMRNAFTTKIDLTHFGIGDAMGCAFAECLDKLPTIESLNLCDNSLTDESLYPILQAVMKIAGLQELNLSRNKIDEMASEALAEYLSNPACPLYKLVLISADVDDGECAAMVECLESNRNLRELDLSNNLLGSAETIPGAATGGAALAEFIMTDGCQLKSLSLAWNTIRANSAEQFCAALAINKTLTYLDLSYNGLGSLAGEILGDSIIENHTLHTVLLKNNNIGSTACVTLCIGICQNFAIKELSIDENPIGEAGARAVMQVPVLIGNRVKLSASNCNTVMRDDKCWYDQANPCRSYSLNLSKPFDRAIAFSVLQVVASHSTNIIVKASFQEANGASFGSKQELSFEQSVATDKELYFDEGQRVLLDGLRTLQDAASDEERGKLLFEEADLDHGGDLDREELLIVMERLGLAEDPERMADILSLFDLDGSGVMQKEEFLEMLSHQSREAGQRIKELTQYPVLSVNGSSSKYIPPKQGMLHMTVVDGFTEKANFSVMTSSDQNNALNMAISMGDSQLVQEAIRSSKIRFSEAESLFRRMYKETGNLAGSVAKLLPQMKSNAEAKQLVSKVTKDDRKLVSQIKQMLGPASKTIFGVPNGYYVLDLSHEYHRICLSRLFEQNQKANVPRQRQCWLGFGVLGDTSQHGNWTSFRNEIFNKVPIEVTPERFTPMPKSGVLEFDFCGGIYPTMDDFAVPDAKFVNVLSNLYMLPEEEDKDGALRQLEGWRKELLYDPAKKVKSTAAEAQRKKALRPEGKLSVFECNRQRSQEMGLAGDLFYESLEERRNQTRQSQKREVINVAFGDEVPLEVEQAPGPPNSRQTSANTTPVVKQRKSLASPLGSRAGSPTPSPAGSPTQRQRKTLFGDITAEEASGRSSSPLEALTEGREFTTTASPGMSAGVGTIKTPREQPGEMESVSKDPRVITRKRLQALVEHEEISDEAKACRYVELIEETFSNIWIDCRQLAAIVRTLPCGEAKQYESFGSYACGVVVSLFSRIVDHYNIELVLRELPAEDAACVYCRIGFLNLWNPTKIEGTLEMNLARREERLVAKMLIYLSIAEPGDNTPQPFFKWKRDLDATPGFEITAPWATEEGLPTKGNLGITFYSGEGKELEGCKPAPAVRRALMQLCLVDETLFEQRFLKLESDRHVVAATGEATPRNSAVGLLKSEANRGIFNNYLVKGCLSGN